MPDRRRAQWFDPIAPAERPPEPDPYARAELVLQAIELLRHYERPGARLVADGLARWLSEGGDLARLLGLRVRRGQRAPTTALRLRARNELLRELVASSGAAPTALASEIAAGETPEARRLRDLGAPTSPRQVARILAGRARRRDTSS
jgi:hypothetical protein